MPDRDDPPSEEELVAAARLRDALGDDNAEGADLARSLRHAFAPAALAKDEHELLVDLALASEEETRLAAKLRDEGDPMVTALAAAWRPAPLDDDAHRAMIEAALTRAGSPARPRGVVIRVAFGAAGVVALAASVLLLVRTAPATELPLARARSTQPLFGEPFKPGDASARIDKIALARASDYRDNRFAKWGVR